MITLLGIPFDFIGMTYFRCEREIPVGELVVCDTPHGTFIGKVAKIRTATEADTAKPSFNACFPLIDRIATAEDRAFLEEAKPQEENIARTTQKQADSVNLSMKIIAAYLDCEDEKALITFTSENRVDFRNLVHTLNGMFHLKIEFRQIGPRDQARLIGGIGPCGLPLCCTTFLDSFDGISISMAKNQLLAINIPKLSGQCGKLMCCLKFEDKAYSELRPLFPKIGEKVTYRNATYEVTGMNLLTGIITMYNGDSYESFTKDEFERVKQGLTKTVPSAEPAKDINSGVDLSGRGIQDTNNRLAQIKAADVLQHQETLKTINKPATPAAPSNNGRGPVNPSRNNNNNYHSGNSNGNYNGQHSNNNRNPSRPSPSGSRPGNPNHGNYSSSQHTGYHSYSGGRPAEKKESGFTPVSAIADKSVLDVKSPVKSDDKK
jgi:cell fate regulator YaaT (PSP1 superfamily)